MDSDLGCESGVGRECPSGLVCVGDRCVATCTSGAQCPTDGECRPVPGSSISFCDDPRLVDADVGPGDGGADAAIPYDASTDSAQTMDADTPSDADAPSDASSSVEDASHSIQVVVFDAGTSSGALGGRTGADALCRAHAPAAYANVHALLSVSATDDIATMPVHYGLPDAVPFVSATGDPIATSLSDLLDGGIGTTLAAAHVYLDPQPWWSGSTSSGQLSGANCLGFSDSHMGNGEQGANDRVDAKWIADTTSRCNVASHVLCLGW